MRAAWAAALGEDSTAVAGPPRAAELCLTEPADKRRPLSGRLPLRGLGMALSGLVLVLSSLASGLSSLALGFARCLKSCSQSGTSSSNPTAKPRSSPVPGFDSGAGCVEVDSTA
eukprot:7295986-Alexandrium_andersonii.AAC.1